MRFLKLQIFNILYFLLFNSSINIFSACKHDSEREQYSKYISTIVKGTNTHSLDNVFIISSIGCSGCMERSINKLLEKENNLNYILIVQNKKVIEQFENFKVNNIFLDTNNIYDNCNLTTYDIVAIKYKNEDIDQISHLKDEMSFETYIRNLKNN